MDFKTEFRAYLNENMLDSIKEKFKEFIDALEQLSDGFTYKVTINGLDVSLGRVNIASIPKKEADDVKKWIKIVQDNAKAEHKKPEVGDFNKELRHYK